MREYTGMSLRGLLWTGPAGYALNMLGFGWHYSLAGSWMGLVYYLGGKTPDWNINYAERNLNGQIAWSELYWGWWIWLILELTCACYVIQAVRRHLAAKNTRSDALDLLHTCWSGCYEMMMFIINIIFACSVGFYQLVQQKDMKNKGQTFFGLFTGVLFLTFVQAFNWGCWWNSYHSKRHRSRLVRSASVANISQSAENDPTNETTPLLPWPQSHPNANQVTQHEPSNGVINHSTVTEADESRGHRCSLLWNRIEMFVHLNSFILLRWFLGVLSALHTILVLLMFIFCIIMDRDSPRLMPFYKIITNKTASDYNNNYNYYNDNYNYYYY